MKKQVKYRVLTIPGKLSLDVKISFDSTRGNLDSDYTSPVDGNVYTTVNIFPLVLLSIVRSSEIDDTGNRQKAPYNQNDNLGMTRWQFPMFVSELGMMWDAMRTPDLYSYVDKQLVVNDELAESVRRVFLVGRNMVVEMVPVVIVQPDDSRVEGIRLKFNNEQSVVPLTLNDIECLLLTMRSLDIDSVCLALHVNYIRDREQVSGGTEPTVVGPFHPTTDIKPKES